MHYARPISSTRYISPERAQARARRQAELRRRRQRALIALVVVVGIVIVLVVSGLGGGAGTNAAQSRRAATARRERANQARHRAPASVRVAYRSLYALPAPLRDPAYTTLSGGRVVTLGGLDSADVSSSEVQVLSTRGVLQHTALPAAQHDAQAATIGADAYVFGGGNLSELDHILRYDPATGAVTQVGALSAPQSDVAVASVGSTAYVVGGYDGTNYFDTIVAWHPGGQPAPVAHLPVGLRYAAVTIAGGGLIVIGGSSPAGATSAIYRYDLTTHKVSRIGVLPHPITHANAATIGSTAYLIGGRGDGLTSQTSAVWAINPVTGHLTSAGRLPRPTSDSATATVGGSILVVGGLSGTTTLASVGELTPAG